MAKSSLIPGRVKNTGKDLFLSGAFLFGSLIALSYLNQRFGILKRFEAGAQGLGLSLGRSVGLGLTNISAGVGQGLFGQSNPSVITGTGQIATTPGIAQQNLRDNLSIGGLLDPNSPNYILKILGNTVPEGVQTAAGDTGAKAGVITEKKVIVNGIPQIVRSDGRPVAIGAKAIQSLEEARKRPSGITLTPIQSLRPEQRQNIKIPIQTSVPIKEVLAKVTQAGNVQGVKTVYGRATPTKNTGVLTTSAGGAREIKNISDALKKRLEMNLSKPTGNSGITTKRPSFTVR